MKPITNVLQEKLVNCGMKQISKEITFKQGTCQSNIHLVFTNKIDKIKKITTDFNTTTAHCAVIIKRHMKIRNKEERYSYARDTKDIDWEDINEKIMNHKDYITAITTEDKDIATELTINIINEILDVDHPMIKKKILTKNNMKKYNVLTKQMIKDCDEKYKKKHEIES